MSLSDRALIFAIRAHEGAYRKDDENKPFVIHPLIAGEILKKAGFDEAVVAAGYLHDVVEDTDYTIEDISRLFGGDVASLVMTATVKNSGLSWKEEKKQKIQNCLGLPVRNKAVIAADKIANLEEILAFSLKNGKVDFSNYGGDYNDQKWYYESVLENLEIDCDDPMLNNLLDRLYNNITSVFYTEFDKVYPHEYSGTISVKDSRVNELITLRDLMGDTKPFIIEFTKNNKRTNLLEIANDFFNEDSFKIKSAGSKDIITEENVLTLSERDSLLFAEIELRFLTEISKGEDILIVEDTLFDKLTLFKRLLNKKIITMEEFQLYINYFKNNINYVTINSPEESKKVTFNSIANYIDMLKKYNIKVPNQDNYEKYIYKIFETILPIMQKERMKELKLYLEEKIK
ncbi:MAG TPA: bifunctional (p)ppGpp synthetase/guanosine-3',5'-bis(diphosphate) 3'-pyrophosphohydrolase [Mollicutes bacterium]|nr:bifunctional (p)ppGpp synthetase/guanosine-3',5'-bis(diphosphate) 3'-pyrophosphohydrolase [Mollicutes bacterium]